MENLVYGLILLLLLAAVSAASAPEVVPKVGVYITSQDIVKARQLVETKSWAAALQNGILQKADEWLEVSDDYIRELLPKPGAIFSYGIAGCPDHNISWTNFGGNGIADIHQPGVLRCPAGHIIDYKNPESKYYDAGNGVWIGGVRYFFEGVYNAAVVNTFTGWGNDSGVLHQLAYAYALTGDDRYAKKAAVIFDALAYLSPQTTGPRDFNANDADIAGRLHFLTSIVNRARVHFVNSFDLLYNHPAMHEKSYYSDMTVAENVAQGILLDYLFDEFDLRGGNLSTLHNHESDALRGMLSVGLVLGIPDYIKWGLQAAEYFFENTIDKDGLYYEGAPAYSVFTQSVFADIAELAYNYNPENYDVEGLPERVNFYDHPKLREFFFSYRSKLDVAGHFASFGNSSPDTARIEEYARDPKGEIPYVDRLYHRTDIPELKQLYKETLLEMSQGNPDSYRTTIWALFHVEPTDEPVEQRYRAYAKQFSAYYSGPSIAILGSGEGRFRRGLILRGGPNLPHSQDDALGLLYYDKGYLITQDVGYNIFGSPVHTGWGSRAVSHNLVVVDNDKYRTGWYKNNPGADLYGFVDLEGFKYVHLDNPHQFPTTSQIKEYSRRTALIDINDQDSYIFDVFTVQGGTRHDYVFHTGAFILETETEFRSIDNVWTLAGLEDPDATYDKPGKSWGERILPGDMIKDLGIASEGVKSMYWNPAPGNGYGFIYDLKEGELTDGRFTGVFKYYDGLDTMLTNRLFVDQETKLYTGYGPNLAGNAKYPYIILRSESPSKHESRVISIMDASLGISFLLDVTRVGENGFVIDILDGQKHYIVLNGGSVETPLGILESHAEFAIAKFLDDEFVELVVVGPGSANFAGEEIAAEAVQAEIVEVNWQNSTVVLEGEIDLQVGELVTIANNAYSRNTAYTVKEVAHKDGRTEVVLNGSMILAKGSVQRGNRDIFLNTPLPTGFSYESSTKYLEGKTLINTRNGEAGIIRSIAGFKRLLLRREIAIEPGDEFVIVDTREEDVLQTLPYAVVKNQ